MLPALSTGTCMLTKPVHHLVTSLLLHPYADVPADDVVPGHGLDVVMQNIRVHLHMAQACSDARIFTPCCAPAGRGWICPGHGVAVSRGAAVGRPSTPLGE
jgi:hypothetical protein